MSQNLTPARVVHPGQILKRELEARGWTQKQLAEIMDRPTQAINEIIQGNKQITPETALDLEKALDSSAEFWLNLEKNYRLHLARKKKNEQNIERRRKLYELIPVDEVKKRQWIPPSDSLDELEKNVCRFLGISSLTEARSPQVNFRKTQARSCQTGAQTAWLKRVEYLAKQQTVGDFNRETLIEQIGEITALAEFAEEVAQLEPLLSSLGVHFVIVPHLSKTYLDGAAFYLDKHPVVAVTLRYDRIDSFWFTVMHELAHIATGHQGIYLDDLSLNNSNFHNLSSEEKEADTLACNWLIDPVAFERFTIDNRPNFSRKEIESFAQIGRASCRERV